MIEVVLAPGENEDRVAVLAYLHDRDVPCPLCEYNLRGLTSPLCPECGNRVRLSVTLAEPYLKAWIALVVAVLPLAGFGFVFLIAFLHEFMKVGHFPPMDGLSAAEGFILQHICASVPTSVLAVVLRRRFLKLKRGVQQTIASAAWLALGISFLCLLAQL